LLAALHRYIGVLLIYVASFVYYLDVWLKLKVEKVQEYVYSVWKLSFYCEQSYLLGVQRRVHIASIFRVKEKAMKPLALRQ
jgi:hypothetical protein